MTLKYQTIEIPDKCHESYYEWLYDRADNILFTRDPITEHTCNVDILNEAETFQRRWGPYEGQAYFKRVNW